MNKVYKHVDHDFRNLTKLVRHFYAFSTIYYEFPNIQPITNINKISRKEEKTLRPEAAQLAW